MIQTAEQKNGMAVAALVLGICALVPVAGIICAILAIVFGIVALSRKTSGRALAIVGVVLAGVGILGQFVVLAFAIYLMPLYAKRSDLVKMKAANTDILRISQAVTMFQINCGRYPTTAEGLEALMTKPAGVEGWEGPYLDKSAGPPKDPWGRPYVYRFPSQLDPEWFDLRSLGPDGQYGTSDDITNWYGED